MKLSFAQRLGNGDVVTILIEPFGTVTSPPKVHSIRCERNMISDGDRRISRFFVDSEQEAEFFVAFIFGPYELVWDYHAYENIKKLYLENKLEDILG